MRLLAPVGRHVDDLYACLTEAIEDAEALLPRLQGLLPHPDSAGPTTGTIGRHKPTSTEPWNTAVADAYWNLWFGSGQLVGMLRFALDLPQLRPSEAPNG